MSFGYLSKEKAGEVWAGKNEENRNLTNIVRVPEKASRGSDQMQSSGIEHYILMPLNHTNINEQEIEDISF